MGRKFLIILLLFFALHVNCFASFDMYYGIDFNYGRISTISYTPRAKYVILSKSLNEVLDQVQIKREWNFLIEVVEENPKLGIKVRIDTLENLNSYEGLENRKDLITYIIIPISLFDIQKTLNICYAVATNWDDLRAAQIKEKIYDSYKGGTDSLILSVVPYEKIEKLIDSSTATLLHKQLTKKTFFFELEEFKAESYKTFPVNVFFQNGQFYFYDVRKALSEKDITPFFSTKSFLQEVFAEPYHIYFTDFYTYFYYNDSDKEIRINGPFHVINDKEYRPCRISEVYELSYFERLIAFGYGNSYPREDILIDFERNIGFQNFGQKIEVLKDELIAQNEKPIKNKKRKGILIPFLLTITLFTIVYIIIRKQLW